MHNPTGNAAHRGLLADASDRLRDVLMRAERLADETDWQCAAARSYRSELAEWVDRLRALAAKVDALEWDARAAAQRLAGVVG